MNIQKSIQKRGEQGIVLLLGIVSLAIVIPMVGISVDVGYLYTNKARMQAAVDGASLAAARSLNLGQTTAQQASTAQQNAVNWFYSNFPPGNWATRNTVMNTGTVVVDDAPGNPNLRRVRVTATTQVPTYFMKWFNFNATTLTSIGMATRRDAVIMLVLDRSSSMCVPNCNACNEMKAAAKLFTGQFAAGRDYIGLVSFSDGTFIHYPPVQNFRTALGYTSGSLTGNGAIDTIVCSGGTGSAEAISMAYNTLYRRYLPGAFNVLVFESDGLPNTLAMNMWDGSSYGFANRDGCKDASGKSKTTGGWTTAASARQWRAGFPMNTITVDTPHVGLIPDIPAGAVGAMYSNDPGGISMQPFSDPFDTSGNSGINAYNSSTMVSCSFTGTATSTASNFADFAWLPGTDIMGNSVKPALNPYKTTVVMNGTHLKFDSSQSTNQRWQNYHDATLNAADNAAYRARANTTIKPTVFVIGLGNTVDHTLLQRVANDPKGDVGGLYADCAINSACVHYDTQYSGTYIYAPTSAALRQKFLELSSQILRLSQ